MLPNTPPFSRKSVAALGIVASFLQAAVLAGADVPAVGAGPATVGDPVPGSRPRTADTARPDKTQTPAAEAKNVEVVTVTGSVVTPMEERRTAIAGKIIVGREEIERFGENTVGALLRRLPGVSYSGNPGRPGEIKMRGLGGGYTQILIDGEKVPPRAGRTVGLDMLPAEMIERIEIIRNPVAEYSAQAIAGTINIVLREDVKRNTNTYRPAINAEGGRVYPQIFAQRTDREGVLSYTLSASLLRRGQIDDASRSAQERDAAGNLTLDEQEDTHRSGNTTEFSFAPRFTWRMPGGNTFSLQTFAVNSHSTSNSTSTILRSVGDAPPYADARQRNDGDNEQLRLMASWNRRNEGGSKLMGRLSVSDAQSESRSFRTEVDEYGALSRLVTDNSTTHTRGASTGWKWSTPLADVHNLALGLDLSTSSRRENRNLQDSAPLTDSGTDSNLKSGETQYALFVMDEWEASPQVGVNAGLRWERADLQVDDSTGQRVNTSSVLSPSLNTVWRFGEGNMRQVRVSFARSFKLPNLGDLSPRLTESFENGPTRPDRTGNPDLKPEVAWGLETAYEYYLKEGGLLSANLFGRDINNLIRRRTELVAGRWLSKPINVAKAQSYGAELEAKFRLDALIDDAPAIDFKTNYSYFISRVGDLPGPDNRLDEQPSALANLGFDYRFKAIPVSVGGNYNWTSAYRVRASDVLMVDIGAKKVLDLFAVWHLSKDSRIRLSVGNLTETAMARTTQTALDAGASRLERTDSPTRQIWSLAWEIKM